MIAEPVLSLMQKEGTTAVITYLRENIPGNDFSCFNFYYLMMGFRFRIRICFF
jgi:hypothetical protein